jgi:group I intron endonuclease
VPLTASVYTITHLPTGLIYIGSARDTKTRWRNHRSQLKLGKHPNPLLQAAWDRDGACAFLFRMVEIVSAEDDEHRLDREQHWLDSTRSYIRGRGMNLYPNARDPSGVPLRPGHRQRIADTLTGRRQSLETRVRKSISMRGNQNGRKKVARGSSE